ncbi:MAG: S9 family peptidase [Acidobacteria bacterium]|nr:S9 family peptidase [Acidobacteriota bacterium]MBW4044940.1 S9 family peptidase [Acidobacteriota bacterium]
MPTERLSRFLAASLLSMLAAGASLHAQQRPPISLDEFMSATEVTGARLSPSGEAAVISTSTADWKNNRFNDELWLWTAKSNETVRLTHTGSSTMPRWSPDGKYIAFTSDRHLPGDTDDDSTERVWVLRTDGGEAAPFYTEKLAVRTFQWKPDSSGIYLSVQIPLTKAEESAQKQQWKDVIRWREQDRGDLLMALPLPAEQPPAAVNVDEPENNLPSNARVLLRSSLAITQIAPSPRDHQIAYESGPPSRRMENPADYEIYLTTSEGAGPKRLTDNQAVESGLKWAPEGDRLYFNVRAAAGSLEGKYKDVQGRIYAINLTSKQITRLGADFSGSWEDFSVSPDGTVIAAGLLGTQQQLYRVRERDFEELAGATGSYALPDAAGRNQHLLFLYSTVTQPTQVFLAADPLRPDHARVLTSFNPIFSQRAQPQWQKFRWKADDGSTVEGMLIYPPGALGKKNLRMFTLIHGGPADADGDRFGADWYDWATLAAAKGWLVFRPNYRGSSGYGDDFELQISPHIVSRPGKDILEGVDALVKEGYADPNHLAIGGYSYGGYMTDWLITQTTRFKAAVTGAGAVENTANWGYDDETFDDAWYLGGTPWENPAMYQSEAAIFQINKVTTPTYIVGGNGDNRVSFFEQILLERALQKLNVPHELLLFPGENHPLDKNPWHGYIKVREELKWLDKYAGQ